MWVLELRGQLDFAAEPLHVHARCQLGEEHLHHNLSVEHPLERKENARHAPAPELALQQIGISKGPLKLLLKAGAHGYRSLGRD
jgi:hypothetical protein